MSELDDLLSELQSPMAAKPPAGAKAKPASNAGDNLDDLLADLSSPMGSGSAKKPAAAPVASKPKQSAALSAADDLDSLLSDLGSPMPIKPAAAGGPKKSAIAPPPIAPAAAAPKATPVTSSGVDDIDSLLSDLGGGAAAKKTSPSAPAKQPVAKPAAANPLSAPKVDDLDALMADLGSPAAKPAPAAAAAVKKAPVAKPAAAAAVSAPKVDDLDALMADLGTPAPAAAKKAPMPQAAAPKKFAQAPPPAAAKKGGAVDDLDALMADLGGAKPAPAAAKPAPAARNTGADELDSLMADLSGGKPNPQARVAPPSAVAPTSAAATTAPVSVGKKSRADELDDLMDSLSGSPSQPRRTGNSSADLDSLMSSLSSSPAQSRSGMSIMGNNHNSSGSNLYGSPSSPSSMGVSPGGGAASNTTARPAMATAVPAGAGGSASSFNDLMTSITTEMADLASGAGGRSRGLCYHCRQPIYDDCMQVLGRTYHPEHFMCGSCNNPLGTGNFYELAGQAHCQRCYQLQFCPKCAHCNQAITDRCVTALDKKWHVHCFVCTQCTSPFNSGNFFERDGRPYCDKCFHQVFAPRCRSCNLPVLGDCVNALGAQWHPEHFNCQFCRRAFTGTFFEYEGMPYCEAHYYQKMGSSCASCQQPISGACVDALGKKWHPEHFVCSFCMNKLEGTSYSEKNAKPYCKPCFGKLFGA